MLRLWFGFLGAPVIWATRFGASYALVPAACGGSGLAWMQAVTWMALAGTAWAGLFAWRAWRGGLVGGGETRAARLRSRFMGAVGLLGSVLFFLVIAAEALALVLVPPCASGGVPL
jgi:hypothetical protein